MINKFFSPQVVLTILLSIILTFIFDLVVGEPIKSRFYYVNERRQKVISQWGITFSTIIIFLLFIYASSYIYYNYVFDKYAKTGQDKPIHRWLNLCMYKEKSDVKIKFHYQFLISYHIIDAELVKSLNKINDLEATSDQLETIIKESKLYSLLLKDRIAIIFSNAKYQLFISKYIFYKNSNVKYRYDDNRKILSVLYFSNNMDTVSDTYSGYIRNFKDLNNSKLIIEFKGFISNIAYPNVNINQFFSVGINQSMVKVNLKTCPVDTEYNSQDNSYIYSYMPNSEFQTQ